MHILAFATTLFDSALRAVDEALGSAASVTKKTSEKVDRAFEMAIRMLERYEMEYHRTGMVIERMKAAKTRDITFSTFWHLKSFFLSESEAGRIQLLPVHLI
jgi:hypothetical protein